MPSSRKRIGYLPSNEVHGIISRICLKSSYSQSKVTGILVEEALMYRGILEIKETREELGFENNIDSSLNELFNYEDNIKTKINDINKNIHFKKELDMINEFIEYKLFKSVITKNRNEFK